MGMSDVPVLRSDCAGLYHNTCRLSDRQPNSRLTGHTKQNPARKEAAQEAAGGLGQMINHIRKGQHNRNDSRTIRLTFVLRWSGRAHKAAEKPDDEQGDQDGNQERKCHRGKY